MHKQILNRHLQIPVHIHKSHYAFGDFLHINKSDLFYYLTIQHCFRCCDIISYKCLIKIIFVYKANALPTHIMENSS